MGVIRAGRGLHTIALQLLSAPRHACSDQDECNGVDDFWHREAGKGRDHDEAEHGAEAGGQQARSQAAEAGGDQNRRDEEQIRRIPCRIGVSAMRATKAMATARGAIPYRSTSCRIKTQRLTPPSRRVSLGLAAKFARKVFMTGLSDYRSRT